MQIIIIGVSGCGKTTVGQALAKKDRIPWLSEIHQYMQSLESQNKDGVVTCSGLKKLYRHILLRGVESDDPNSQSSSKKCLNKSSVLFVLLHGKEETLQRRMDCRKDHFMPASLLPSQLATLEHPDDTEHYIIVDIDNTVDDIVSRIITAVQTS
ncbi:probable gluconokinase isoform X2 [Pecten maximus]|uniref:probable gluconokinase isoform X2 n=1 Tax=Pecten maximus TaxID=6579 RepID=UPI0014583980|nr:probable gluconokinase isoform X2 [Pecten maximus]